MPNFFSAAPSARHRAALLAQLPLRGHVVEFEGIDVLLTVVGGAVSKHNHVAAALEGRYETVQLCRFALRRHQKNSGPARNDRSKPVHECLRQKQDLNTNAAI
jgi:hypothetical protein